MADDKLLSFFWQWNLPTITDRSSFFQDEYDDSLALAMAAVGDNIITFKYVIFIFSPLKIKLGAAILYAQTKTKHLFLELSGDFFC